MTQTKILFTHDGQEGVAYNKASWQWGNHSRATIDALNPKLRLEIDGIVEALFIAVEKADKLKKAEEHKKFKEMVAQANKDNITTKFDDKSDPRTVTLSKMENEREVTATINHSDKVWDDWSHHTTNKPWIMGFEYKNIRYKSFENAFNSAVKKIETKIQDTKDKRQYAKEANIRDHKFNIELLDNYGLHLVKDNRKSFSNYKIGMVINSKKHKNYDWYDNAEIWGRVYTDIDNKKKLSDYQLNEIKIKGKMTLRGMSKVAKLLETLVKDKDLEEE